MGVTNSSITSTVSLRSMKVEKVKLKKMMSVTKNSSSTRTSCQAACMGSWNQ